MVATLAFFVAPGMMELDTRRKLLVSLILLASPTPLIVLRYALAIVWMFGQRVYYYEQLYRMLELRVGTNDTLSRHLSDSIENWPRYEILKVHWFRERSEMYILIRKKRGKQPDIGATFCVYDTHYGRPMAFSEMIENRGDGYYSRITGYIDPVWLGEVRKLDLPELPPPPAVSACLGPRREES